MPIPDLSVVIAARNAAHTLGDTMKALAAQDLDGLTCEVIVVDNGSTDDTAEVAESYGATVVRHATPGPAAARNAGLAVARGAIICVTDADCRPVPGWLEAISRPLREDPGVTASKGAYLCEQPELVARFVQLEYEDKYDLLSGQGDIDFVDTYSAAYRREALVRCGGFDESARYLEDQELSFRLAEMGARMVFAPTALVYHLHASSVWSYATKKHKIGYWKAQVVRRYPNVAVKDSHTPQVMKVQMLLVLAAGVCVPVLAVWPGAAAAGLGVASAGFAASSVPFVRKAIGKDRAVAMAAPALLAVRAAALTTGYLRGTLDIARGRRLLNAPRPADGILSEPGLPTSSRS